MCIFIKIQHILLDGKKDEKTNNTRTICVFSSNRALIG
jgi:hypothetical protein